MKKADFSLLGKKLSVFDTDTLNIYREQKVQNWNGSWETFFPDEPVYADIPCHLTYQSVDNPDPSSVGMIPIIETVIVHLAPYIDIRNGDKVVAFKRSADQYILKKYTGVASEPSMAQSRQVFQITSTG